MNSVKAIIFVLIILVISIACNAEEFILDGSQESVIDYHLQQVIEPFPGIDDLIVFFVIPQDYNSPTFNQSISKLKFNFSQKPDSEELKRDDRGNKLKKLHWKKPKNKIICDVTLQAVNKVELSPLVRGIDFPLKDLPDETKIYLESTGQVQSDDDRIKSKSAELTMNAEDEFAAVRSILHYVVDKMVYVLIPKQYDALYSFNTGKGNCQNFSHLTAALMRAAGIPARIVNGITLKKAYDIDTGDYVYSFEMAQGRHSWIEVYFPDMGWIPFDPQQTSFFVHNRYLRIETGLDNNETGNDGLIQWTESPGTKSNLPKVEEAFEADFIKDDIQLNLKKSLKQPKKLMLSTELIYPALAISEETEELVSLETAKKEEQVEVIREPETEAPAEIDYGALTYDQPFKFGNLEFPENFNFLAAKLTSDGEKEHKGQIKQKLIVETAEYVTSKNDYAQTFLLDKPVVLSDISLALYNFGGDGKIWLELSEDNKGKPGEVVASSGKLSTRQVQTKSGYNWVAFGFSRQGIGLTPGRYWLILRHSGFPIVNWFYSYGKPVGPIDGTRASKAGTESWDRVLQYEFNYIINGKTANIE